MVKINAKVFMMNAFSAIGEHTQFSYLNMDILRLFSDILSNKFSEAGHKYVFLDVDNSALMKLCDIDDRFIKGIGKIFCTKKITEEEIKQVNVIYEPEVQIVLNDARKNFMEEIKYRLL